MERANVDGMTLEYEVQGSGERVVFITAPTWAIHTDL